MAISKTFHNITSSNNNVYIKQLPTYFFSFKCDIEIRLVDLLRDCRPPRTCKIDLGETGNHLHRRDRKNVQLYIKIIARWSFRQVAGAVVVHSSSPGMHAYILSQVDNMGKGEH